METISSISKAMFSAFAGRVTRELRSQSVELELEAVWQDSFIGACEAVGVDHETWRDVEKSRPLLRYFWGLFAPEEIFPNSDTIAISTMFALNMRKLTVEVDTARAFGFEFRQRWLGSFEVQAEARKYLWREHSQDIYAVMRGGRRMSGSFPCSDRCSWESSYFRSYCIGYSPWTVEVWPPNSDGVVDYANEDAVIRVHVDMRKGVAPGFVHRGYDYRIYRGDTRHQLHSVMTPPGQYREAFRGPGLPKQEAVEGWQELWSF